MQYEKEIIQVLIEAGNTGLPINKITRHVFNLHNTFFDNMDYKNMYQSIYRCIKHNLRRNNSLIINADRHGYYTINLNYNTQQQFIVWLNNDKVNIENLEKDVLQIDQSLSLF